MSHTRILNFLKTNWHGSRRLAFACALLVTIAAAPLRSQTYQDLYDFNCNTGGCNPFDSGQLTQGVDGNFYGTTQNGGSNGSGTIFMVTPTGASTDLWQFDGINGANPYAGLSLASDGNFYGTTAAGGQKGYGTVFRFTPPATFTVLHSFNFTDGDTPEAAPVEAKDGNLYGATYSGKTYRITLPAGTFKQLPNNTPGFTFDPLILASDGNLYGTTFNGGAFGPGTVFRMTTAGAIKVIYSFSGAGSAGFPQGPLTQASDGNLYGTTHDGGANNSGTVFKLTLLGNLTVLHSFDGYIGGFNNDGGGSVAGLLAASDGNLYGANSLGGASGNGTLFLITKGGSFTKLVDLSGTAGGAPGASPLTTPVQHTNGAFYGLTYAGGSAGSGNFYSLTPTNRVSIVLVEGPVWLKPGQPVEILGNNMNEVSSITFAGVQANFQPGSDTYLVAQVPSAAVDGLITATLVTGLRIESAGAMRILPVITNLDPSSGPVGTQVNIVGGGFAGARKVSFGGVKATSFKVNSPTLIQAIVPTGSKTGKVSVVTPNGTAISKQTFTVN